MQKLFSTSLSKAKTVYEANYTHTRKLSELYQSLTNELSEFYSIKNVKFFIEDEYEYDSLDAKDFWSLSLLTVNSLRKYQTATGWHLLKLKADKVTSDTLFKIQYADDTVYPVTLKNFNITYACHSYEDVTKAIQALVSKPQFHEVMKSFCNKIPNA
ncbi:hypothetical protein ACOLXF_002164 [Vibrio fluvialis]